MLKLPLMRHLIRLTGAGCNYQEVRQRVNKLLS